MRCVKGVTPLAQRCAKDPFGATIFSRFYDITPLAQRFEKIPEILKNCAEKCQMCFGLHNPILFVKDMKMVLIILINKKIIYFFLAKRIFHF